MKHTMEVMHVLCAADSECDSLPEPDRADPSAHHPGRLLRDKCLVSPTFPVMTHARSMLRRF